MPCACEAQLLHAAEAEHPQTTYSFHRFAEQTKQRKCGLQQREGVGQKGSGNMYCTREHCWQTMAAAAAAAHKKKGWYRRQRDWQGTA